MRLFFRFVRMKYRSISFLLGCCVIFGVAFALYRLPLGAVLYASAICLFFAALVFVLRYLAFLRRHKQLQMLQREVAVSLDNLLLPDGLIEEDYQAILRTLFQKKQALSDEMAGRYTDLVEYYTLWAHQIKTPIAAMHLLLQGEDSDFGRELSDELQRIEQYVEMVLCYLRLDSSESDYVIRTYDLDAIVKQAVKKYASQFIRKKIHLEYEPLGCEVLTDEKWLLFVVEQVLSNALKYTKKGGSIAIVLETPKILCIRDTGIGIAPEDLPRIFEKGYTGYNGRSDKKASGIGLYLCRRICENLGHRISAVSAPGEGTVIRLDLASAALEVE